MGYLNPSPDDDAHIQAMADGGTTELPGASGLDGLLSSIPKGFVSGVDKVQQLSEAVGASDTGSELYSAFTHIPQSYIQRTALRAQDIEKNDANVKAIQQWSATGQDPRVTGALGRTVDTLASGLTIAGLGTATGGPWGAAALLGSSEGYGDYLQNKADGLDENTAQEKAGITGLAAAASAFIPVKFGKTALQSVVGGIASNQMVGIASRAATHGVLYANGYTAMAQQAKVFDGEAMLADTIMGAAFGAMGHFSHGAPEALPERINPADVDAAAATLVENHLNRSAPGIPTDPEVANLHVDTMQHAIDALTNGREVDTPSEPAARTLLAGSLPDPAHDMAPTILEAAHSELPGFTDAIEPMAERPLPAREPVESPLGLHLAADGTPSPTQFDPSTQYQLDRLVSRYPDLQITREDGSTATMREVAQEMQQQMADAQKMADAHEAAAACFIATGGAA